METFGLALIPITAAYFGWLTKLVVDSVRLQSSLVKQVDTIAKELEHQDQRIDSLVSSRFLG